MWTRAELKEKAKLAFKANYWKCVLIALILGAVTAVGNSGSSFSGSNSGRMDEMFSNLSLSEILAVMALTMGIVITAIAVSVVVKILVKNPVSVACHKFYLENAEKPAGFGAFKTIFGSGSFINIFVVMFMCDLFVALFTLLFIIPGIIKAYQYRMVPYILAENPKIGWRKALDESSRMMAGEKMNTFVLDLSFIGWGLLSAVTLGLVGLFYADPYYRATDAELYRVLKTK